MVKNSHPAVIGRLAPSPTGRLHVGNARSLLLAWLSARSCGGKIVLRIEDLLPGQPEKVTSLLSDLSYLGLDWDDPGVDLGRRQVTDYAEQGETGADFALQSERHDAYHRVLMRLVDAGLVYPCICTRKDIEQAVRAPHDETRGRAYPGTCRGRFVDIAAARRYEAAQSSRAGRRPAGVALRMRVDSDLVRFEDVLCGEQEVCLTQNSGDFVIRRKDGAFAYMLAVVVDDVAMGVNEVVRGDDILECTAQQVVLYRAISEHCSADEVGAPVDRPPPRWLHVPLVHGDDGRRLAKRDRSIHVQALLQTGVSGERFRRYLAGSLGLPETDDLYEMASAFSWDRVPRAAVVFGATELAALR